MRVQLDFDLRDEDWDAVVGRFSMRRIEAGASFTFAAAAWRFRSGGSFAIRKFDEADPAADATYLRDGTSLK